MAPFQVSPDEANTVLPPNFSQCSCVKSEAERGKRIKEMGHPHVTPITVFDLCDSPVSSKGSALWGQREFLYPPNSRHPPQV